MARKTIQIAGLGENDSTTTLGYTQGTQERKIEGFSDVEDIQDIYFKLDNNVFSPSNVYILSLKTKQCLNNASEHNNETMSNPYSFDIVLASNSDSAAFQTLKTITVPEHFKDDKVLEHVCIFQPLITFDTILLKLQLTLYDLQNKSPREIQVEGATIKELKNILNTAETRTSLERIGLQGKPGALFAIDGEEMKLNKNGIYEISYDNLDVQHIGWVEGDFLLDITYTYDK